ncbi:MAG TPA: propionyl-CoA carboxylase, partial [Rhodospirillaceae bacterium]|nr:propionyl-CoA carboxylase [Rhodospirillaceae bacterium]
MSWKPEVDEIEKRYAWAEEMGGEETISKRHEKGYLTVRERIAECVDDGSFREVGKMAGRGEYKDGKLVGFTPAPYVMGMAKIDGRPVAIGGEDTTLRGGTNWGTTRRKGGQGGFIDDFAYFSRIPLIRLIDGYGGSASTAKRLGFAALPGHSVENNINPVELMESVPVVGAVMGIAAGGPAGRAVYSHWSVMVKGQSQIFAAGPSVVERGIGRTVSKEELGGYKVSAEAAGVIHNVAKSEAECCQQIRKFLSYLPSNVWQLPPVVDVGDPPDRVEEELLSIVPRDRRQPYDMRKVI